MRLISEKILSSFLLPVLFAVFTMFNADISIAASGAVGYVDLQRAILQVNEGKRAKTKLQKTFEKKSKKLKSDEEKLLKMRSQLESQFAGRKMDALQNDPKMREQAMAYEQKRMQIQQALMKERQELQQLEQKALLKITKKMRKVIKKIGDSGKYLLILESQDARMLYAKPHLDLTNEVIRKYNKKHK